MNLQHACYQWQLLPSKLMLALMCEVKREQSATQEQILPLTVHSIQINYHIRIGKWMNGGDIHVGGKHVRERRFDTSSMQVGLLIHYGCPGEQAVHKRRWEVVSGSGALGRPSITASLQLRVPSAAVLLSESAFSARLRCADILLKSAAPPSSSSNPMCRCSPP